MTTDQPTTDGVAPLMVKADLEHPEAGYTGGEAQPTPTSSLEETHPVVRHERLNGTRETTATLLGRIYDDALMYARAAAHKHGYAIAVHGSEMRDLDLVAVPWTEEASDPDTLAEAIREMTGGTFGQHPREKRPHGRLAWSIHLNNEHTLGNFKSVLPYIDLSVMPTAAAARAEVIREVEALQARVKVLEDGLYRTKARAERHMKGPDAYYGIAMECEKALRVLSQGGEGKA